MAQSVNFTVTGTNEAPVVASAMSASATKDAATAVSHNLQRGASDVDTDDTLSGKA